MTTAYFDCFGGAAGDMIVAGLLDAGAALGELREQLGRLPLDGYTLAADHVTRGTIAGTLFTVALDEPPAEHHHPHHHHHGRNLPDIFALLDAAGYPRRVDDRIRRIFRRLAAAEAKVHNTTVEAIHFHEVGAVDSIVDIAGAVLAMEQLNVERIVASPIPMGRGTIHCAHGVLPVPAPATAELMRAGAIAASDAVGELCTPTGAAILTTLADAFGPLPPLAVDAIGYGAGSRDDEGRINMLRVFVGRDGDETTADTVVELAANVDDTSGELIGAVLGLLLEAGALDAWATPMTMKKSRPALQVGVLCRPADVERLEELLLRETTTIGVRRHACARTKLQRTTVTVETAYGPVRVKLSGRGGQTYTAAPEFDDCARAATAHHVPIRQVQAAALAAREEQAP